MYIIKKGVNLTLNQIEEVKKQGYSIQSEYNYFEEKKIFVNEKYHIIFDKIQCYNFIKELPNITVEEFNKQKLYEKI